MVYASAKGSGSVVAKNYYYIVARTSEEKLSYSNLGFEVSIDRERVHPIIYTVQNPPQDQMSSETSCS